MFSKPWIRHECVVGPLKMAACGMVDTSYRGYRRAGNPSPASENTGCFSGGTNTKGYSQCTIWRSFCFSNSQRSGESSVRVAVPTHKSQPMHSTLVFLELLLFYGVFLYLVSTPRCRSLSTTGTPLRCCSHTTVVANEHPNTVSLTPLGETHCRIDRPKRSTLSSSAPAHGRHGWARPSVDQGSPDKYWRRTGPHGWWRARPLC